MGEECTVEQVDSQQSIQVKDGEGTTWWLNGNQVQRYPPGAEEEHTRPIDPGVVLGGAPPLPQIPTPSRRRPAKQKQKSKMRASLGSHSHVEPVTPNQVFLLDAIAASNVYAARLFAERHQPLSGASTPVGYGLPGSATDKGLPSDPHAPLPLDPFSPPTSSAELARARDWYLRRTLGVDHDNRRGGEGTEPDTVKHATVFADSCIRLHAAGTKQCTRHEVSFLMGCWISIEVVLFVSLD